MYTAKLSEQLAVVATIDPDAYTASTVLTDAIDMSKFRRVMFIVMAGELGASATVDFKVTECATSGGSYTDLSGKSITQLTQAGSDDDKQVIVEVAAAEMGSGKRYLKGSLTIGTATSDAGVIALASVGRHKPENANDLASVDEIVS